MASFPKRFINNITSREQPSEKGMFLIRLGSLMDSGYSIKDALRFLKKIEKGMTLKWIEQVEEGMLRGNTFHDELERIGFPNKVCAQIYFASKFGNYNQAMIQCGEQLIDDLERKKKFKTLATYPFILVIFLIGMLLMMRFIILPHMNSLFNSTGSEGNIYSNLIVRWIYYSPQILIISLLTILLLIFIIKVILRDKNFIERIEIFNKVPFLKVYLKDYWSDFFFREWGSLLKNGCSFHEILTIMSHEEAAQLLQDVAHVLSAQLVQGISVHNSLNTLPFFHEEGKLVVNHGENIGQLGTEMLIYASFCENEFNTRIESLMGKLQPIIFSLVALMIIAIYASLMLPIFSLMKGF